MDQYSVEPSEQQLAGIRAHDRIVSSSIQDVVRELVHCLGATMVAAIGGVSETRAVRQWMTDRDPQRPHVLRFALQLALLIREKGDKDMVRAWFTASNPHLNDSVPLLLLRERQLGDVQGPMMAAARAFSARAYPATSA